MTEREKNILSLIIGAVAGIGIRQVSKPILFLFMSSSMLAVCFYEPSEILELVLQIREKWDLQNMNWSITDSIPGLDRLDQIQVYIGQRTFLFGLIGYLTFF